MWWRYTSYDTTRGGSSLALDGQQGGGVFTVMMMRGEEGETVTQRAEASPWNSLRFIMK
jgi:hypothetical protein